MSKIVYGSIVYSKKVMEKKKGNHLYISINRGLDYGKVNIYIAIRNMDRSQKQHRNKVKRYL